MATYYYDSGNSADFLFLANRIRDTCLSVQNNTDTPISEHAIALIVNSLMALRDDPSPDWKVGRNDLIGIWQSNLDNLEKNLYDLVKQPTTQKGVTYFEVFHWLHSNARRFGPFNKD